MSNEQKRYILSKAYPGPNWQQKVTKMSDAQVHVIYMRLLYNNKLKGLV